MISNRGLKRDVHMRLSRYPLLRIEMIVAGSVVFLVPATAWANPIVPPIVVVWPAAWILFVPVVLIEAATAVRVLGVTYGAALWLSFRANLLSTALGIPIGTCFSPIPLMLIGDETSSLASALLFLTSLLLALY
jgi:hypothetical protein